MRLNPDSYPVLNGYGIGIFSADPTKTERSMCIIATVTNVAGWLPVVGIVAGIAHLIFANDCPRERSADRKARKGLIIRGVAEICGVGFLAASVDVYCSVGRLAKRHFGKPPHRH